MGDFVFISVTGDRVPVPLDSLFIRQSVWLQAAVDVGEQEGVVPVARTETLHRLVEYMVLQARRMAEVVEGIREEEQSVVVPITCITCSGSENLGYDVHSLLPSDDVVFFDRFGGKGDVWEVVQQESLLELMVTADFVGHERLSRSCAVYVSCRLMSATESDILSWFWGSVDQRFYDNGLEAGARGVREPAERILSDAERLRILKQMKRYVVVDDWNCHPPLGPSSLR